MVQYLVKVAITAILVVLVAEAGKRSVLASALLASVPLVSVLGLVWLYVDTGDTEKVAAFSQSIIWFVLPSLVLFVVLPALLKQGLGFYVSLGLSVAATFTAYLLMVAVLRRFG